MCYVYFYCVLLYIHWTALISYLRGQKNLIAYKRNKTPKVSDTRWDSMSEVSSWFKLYWVAVDEYRRLKEPACTPPPFFWAQLMFVQSFSHRTTINFREIQCHDVTVGFQQSCLNTLKEFFLKAVGGIDPVQEW